MLILVLDAIVLKLAQLKMAPSDSSHTKYATHLPEFLQFYGCQPFHVAGNKHRLKSFLNAGASELSVLALDCYGIVS